MPLSRHEDRCAGHPAETRLRRNPPDRDGIAGGFAVATFRAGTSRHAGNDGGVRAVPRLHPLSEPVEWRTADVSDPDREPARRRGGADQRTHRRNVRPECENAGLLRHGSAGGRDARYSGGEHGACQFRSGDGTRTQRDHRRSGERLLPDGLGDYAASAG
ncbi:hypothetical protein SDC9_204985 [bioreactor metagenome]|uniref:Uncharacterized protein n=1 Tax=bioreactor metagenome TaxID=1076179 RepID=A0A645J122_9ZZZZ